MWWMFLLNPEISSNITSNSSFFKSFSLFLGGFLFYTRVRKMIERFLKWQQVFCSLFLFFGEDSIFFLALYFTAYASLCGDFAGFGSAENSSVYGKRYFLVWSS